MAEWKPRIDLINRTKLETVIPLQTPFIVFIDPSDVCNFQCKFCPTGDREKMKTIPDRNAGAMDFELYKKIIDDLDEFPDQVKVIRLYKDGEPLVNPHFVDMIKYAKASPKVDRVDTTTNGALLTKEIADGIIEAGLDRINISIEGVTDEQYLEFSKCKVNYKELRENITYLYEHKTNLEMIVKINGDVISAEERQKFLDDFNDITDGIFVESVMDCWPEFEQTKVEVNQEKGIYGQELKEVSVCPYVFYSIAVNASGSVSLCFLDWSRKLLLGSIKEHSLKEFWNSDKMNAYRRSFLAGNRKKCEVCKDCGQLKGGMPDNIDPYKDELLKHFL